MNYQIQQIHFIGIGGVGMCGIATVLAHNSNYYITGSDILENEITHSLSMLGIKIFFGHRFDNIEKSDVVVFSSAISKNNPEIIAAQQCGIPIIRRAEMLSEIMRCKYGIAISGTHGKTTTTTMIIDIFIKAGLDPTFINGGLIKSQDVYARVGNSHYLIAEADESDGSFLCLNPIVVIVTNIDFDHMDAYRGNFYFLKQAFINFLNNLPLYGYGVICIDDPVSREILFAVRKKKIITYGFSLDADMYICCYQQYVEKSVFTILNRRTNKEIQVVLNTVGRHNVLNAVAAITVAIEEGISKDDFLKAMSQFQGTARRFEQLGCYSLYDINGQIGHITLVDDYGHHPTELNITIETIRTIWPNKRLVMVFQLHRFTRTRDLYYEFVHVLSNVDVLLMTHVFSAGENFISGFDAQSMCRSIQKYGKIKPIFVESIEILSDILFLSLRDNDLLLIQGAGTIGSVIRKLIIKK